MDVIDIICGNGHDRRFRLRPASAVEFRPVRWAWSQRIPLGGVTLLPGREGLGKSLVAHDLGARITRGQLEGDLAGVPADVVVIGSEDAVDTVSGPRFAAAGADLTRVHYLVADDESLSAWTVSDGIDELERLAAGLDRCGLVVVDPLDAHLDVDTHKKGETQRAIGALSRLAQTLDCAVLGLAHHSKAPTTDPLRLVTGSVAFTTAVRSVVSVALHPEEPAERVLALSKSNLAAREQVPVLRFRIEPRVVVGSDGTLVSTAGLVWLGEAHDVDADQLFRAADPDEGAQLADAREFLAHALAAGPRLARDVKADARREGISERTLARARVSLSVRVERTGFPCRSVWMLPDSPDVPTADGTSVAATTGTTDTSRLGGGFEPLRSPSDVPVVPFEYDGTTGTSPAYEHDQTAEPDSHGQWHAGG